MGCCRRNGEAVSAIRGWGPDLPSPGLHVEASSCQGSGTSKVACHGRCITFIECPSSHHHGVLDVLSLLARGIGYAYYWRRQAFVRTSNAVEALGLSFNNTNTSAFKLEGFG